MSKLVLNKCQNGKRALQPLSAGVNVFALPLSSSNKPLYVGQARRLVQIFSHSASLDYRPFWRVVLCGWKRAYSVSCRAGRDARERGTTAKHRKHQAEPPHGDSRSRPSRQCSAVPDSLSAHPFASFKADYLAERAA